MAIPFEAPYTVMMGDKMGSSSCLTPRSSRQQDGQLLTRMAICLVLVGALHAGRTVPAA